MNLRSILAPGLLSVLSAFAAAGATLTDPSATFSVGIDDSGVLYDRATNVGFERLSDGYDPILPRVPRDSWSVFAGGKTYDADPNFLYGNDRIVTQPVSAEASMATTITTFGDGNGSIAQRFAFVAPNVLHVALTVTNYGAPTDFQIRRDVDWDIDPTLQAEFVDVPVSIPSNVTETSYFGFEDPTAPFKSTGTGTFGPGDFGGGLTVDLGTLASGASATTDFYYAIGTIGQSPASLRAQLAALGVGYSIVGGSSDGGDLGSASHCAALGIAAPVPEPAPLAALALGLVALRRSRP